MNSNYFWVFKIVAGFIGVFGLQYGIKKILSLAGKKRGETWRFRIAKVLKPPVTVLIWVLFVVYAINILGQQFDFSYGMDFLSAIRKAAIIICSAWLFFRWENEIENVLLADSSKKIDVTTVRMIGRLATLAIGLVTVLVTLQTFGINIVPLLTVGSIGAAAIGFAGKDVIANFCSGIMLQITRPFIRGEQILLPEKQIEGHVEDIGWFRTSIRDIEKRAVYLPNNYFSTMVVVNVSRMTHKRFKQTLKLPLSAIEKISDAVPKVRQAIASTESIDTHYPVHVFLKTFGDYACEIEIEAYSTVTNIEAFNRFQQMLLLKIQGVLADKEIHLAIPTMTWKQTF